MKRHNIEFLWAWFDALRRNDSETMAAALDPNIVWHGIQEGLACHGPQEVIATFVSGYDANQEIDSLELIGADQRIVLGVRGPDLGEIDDVPIGGEIYNVFTIRNDKIIRIDDYLQRDQALAAAGLT